MGQTTLSVADTTLVQSMSNIHATAGIESLMDEVCGGLDGDAKEELARHADRW